MGGRQTFEYGLELLVESKPNHGMFREGNVEQQGQKLRRGSDVEPREAGTEFSSDELEQFDLEICLMQIHWSRIRRCNVILCPSHCWICVQREYISM